MCAINFLLCVINHHPLVVEEDEEEKEEEVEVENTQASTTAADSTKKRGRGRPADSPVTKERKAIEKKITIKNLKIGKT